MTRSRRLILLGLLGLLAAGVFAVYAPGLNGPFQFDDYPNIVKNPLVRLDGLDAERLRDAAFSWGNNPYPHRGLARLTFALNYYFSGGRFDSFVFKLTNVVIHVLNGLLVYWLSALLLRRYASVARPPTARAGWSAMQSFLPLLVAALWLLHPIQLTSVLYVVQRMTSMSASFVLLGLAVFVLGRTRLESGRAHAWTLMLAGLGGGVVLGFLCKQNAVLLPLFAFLVELFFFRHEALPVTSRRRLYGLYALTVGLPVIVGLLGLVFAWDVIAEGYLHRDFTPWERLLTQSRVLFFYLGLLLFPHIRAFGLYHDDIALSTGLLEPWTTLPAVLGWLALVALALWGIRRRALWSFAVLWYLVGHALESSLLGLELVFEHRNYLPSFGVLFAAAYYLVRALDWVADGRRLVYPVLGLLVAVLAFTTFTRAGIWGDKITWNLFTAENHPESYRSLTSSGILSIAWGSDAREIFAALEPAESARETSIIAPVERSKIAAGLRALVDGAESAEHEDPARFSDEELLTRPLVLSAPYLKAVEEALDRKIRYRLQTYPVHHESAEALDRIADCLAKKIDVCVPLKERLQQWYDIALANPRTTASIRGRLLLNRALLHDQLGELAAAEVRIREAIATEPRNLSYSFTLVKFHIRHEQWVEADRVLDTLEANLPWSGFGSRHVASLRKQYEDRMQSSAAEAK